SLSLTPMLAGRFLRAPDPPRNRFMKALETGFSLIETGYARALDVVLRHMRATLAVFVLTAIAAVTLYAIVPTGFFPQQDTGFIFGLFATSQDASFTKASQKAEAVDRVLQQDPAIAGFGMFVGGSSTNQGNLFISLKPKDDGRKASADQVITRLRPKLAQLVGVQTFLQAAQDINVGGRAGRAQYQYTLADSDLDELNSWAPRMLAALQAQASAVMMTIDRDAAGRFGISPANIDAALYDLIGQDEVAQYFTQLNAYHVVVEAPPKLAATTALFNTVRLLSPITGKTVPLSVFVKVNPNATSSLTISHQGQFPAATLSFN